MKLYLSISFFLLSVFFVGCELDPFSSSSSSSQTTDISTQKQYIDIFTVAPAKNLLLQDSNNQVALYDDVEKSYYFKESIAYPISATTTSKTYIDVDYDSNITSADLVPSLYFSSVKLQSFCSEVNFLTSYYYNSKMEENNISVESYKDDIKTRFGIDLCANPLQNKENAITLFGAYNAVTQNNSLDSLDVIEAEVTKVEEFFTDFLSFLNTTEEKVKYYSFYDALLKLDQSLIQRADTGHKPLIPTVVKSKSALVNYNSSIDVFDIVTYNDTLLLAAGHDELASTDIDLENVVFSSNVKLDSFGSQLNLQEYNGIECLFLANAKEGMTSFELDGTVFTKELNATSQYINSSNQLTSLIKSGVTNMNNYVSLNENKRLLGISTMDMGYYLLDIKNSFQGCSRIVDIDEDTDFLIAEQSGYSVDAVFRDDGTYLYVAHKGNGISGYKTDILERDVIKNSSTTFSLKDGQSAYNLKLYNNNNELFVTTDKGVLIYDVGSSRDELSYVSEYLSEGAQKDYYPAIDSFEDYIFITDGYKGVKVLKLNNSFHPMLCGVEYFAPNNNDYELSKTTSVKYDKGYLYVGVTSQGIAKLKLEDLLFEHCK